MQNVEILHTKKPVLVKKTNKMGQQSNNCDKYSIFFSREHLVSILIIAPSDNGSIFKLGHMKIQIVEPSPRFLLERGGYKSIHGQQSRRISPDGFTQLQATTPCWRQVGGNLKPIQPSLQCKQEAIQASICGIIFHLQPKQIINTCRNSNTLTSSRPVANRLVSSQTIHLWLQISIV